MRILGILLALLLAGCSATKPIHDAPPSPVILSPVIAPSIKTFAVSETQQPQQTNMWYQTPYGYLEALPKSLLYFQGSNLVWVASTMHESAVQKFGLFESSDLEHWVNLTWFNAHWGTNVIPSTIQFTNQIEFFRVSDHLL